MPDTSVILFYLSLLALAAIASPVSEKLRLPYPVVLVLTGYVASEFATGSLQLDIGINWQNLQTIIFYVLIPVLIFRAAIEINPEKLIRETVIISTLALPLMLVSTAIIAVLIYLAVDHSTFPWVAALIAGVLLSATDPSAVVSVLERLEISDRLLLILEGESLFNDVTAIVLFSILVGIAGAGQTGNFAWLNLISHFMIAFAGGIAVGIIVASVALSLVCFNRRYSLQGLISIIGVYGAYIIAEKVLHVSGVMAVLTLGLVLGYFNRLKNNPGHQDDIQKFWSITAGIAEILIFLLAGVSIIPDMFVDRWYVMLAGIFAIVCARAIAIFGGLSLIGLFSTRLKLKRNEQAVIYWGGVRGTVTLALALSIPLTLDYWYTIQSIAYGVVLFTLFVQATTMPPLVTRLFKQDK